MSANPYQSPAPVAAPPSKPLNKPFNVMVKSEAPTFAKGQFTCEITPQGITLRKRKQEITIPLGGKAEYLGKNRFAVPSSGGRLEITIAKFGGYQVRLARDLVQFLNGQGPQPQLIDYGIPWPLFLLAALPIGIPIVTLGGVLPAMIGFGLAAGNMAIARNEDMPMGVRIGLCLASTTVAYVIFIGLMAAAFAARAAQGL